jgi:hypothetical protein
MPGAAICTGHFHFSAVESCANPAALLWIRSYIFELIVFLAKALT